MRIIPWWRKSHLALFLLMTGGCSPASSPHSLTLVSRRLELSSSAKAASANEPIRPLVAPTDLDPERVLLGRQLFHDARLSSDGTISCASCHDIANGGDDGLQTARGINDQIGTLNTPTVLNCSLSIAQFWDGRVESLEEQIPGPIHNPIEMGSNWDEAVRKLRQDPAFVSRFTKAYPKGVTAESIVDAIATYERALVTVGAPFDDYLRGQQDAISSTARNGYELFKEIGCVSCHQGRTVGGNMFQEFGVMGDYFSQISEPSESDNGRINATYRAIDLHRFKVPSLRNVELTAPYFHNGRAATLDDAIKTMAEFQLGTHLETSEIAQIRAFLETLTGKVREDLK